jgi:hypothetical protein
MTKHKTHEEEPAAATTPGTPVTQLACRVPKELYRVVRVFCVSNETSVADFVAEALRHELERRRAHVRQRRAEPAAEPTPKKKRQIRVWDEGFDDDENAA